MEHVADEPVLEVIERGDRATIGIHPNQALDHEWAGNVVDLCPVGSLLSKDTLHKARAWELDKTASICTGCSQGCNINVDTRNNVVVRLRPRPNEAVNHYFMCDTGRHEYRWMNRGDRIEAPLIRSGDAHVAVDWDHALERAAEILRGAGGKAAVLVSPRASTEAMFLAKRVLAKFDAAAVFRVRHVAGEVPLPGVPNLALREERAPNGAGARALGFVEGDAGEALAGATVAIVVDDDLHDVDGSAIDGVGHMIYVGTALPDAAGNASVVLPCANVVEEDGSFVNRDGRVQRYRQARTAPGMARPAWWILSALLREMGEGDGADTAASAFAMVAASEPAFHGLSYETVGFRGVLTADVAEVSS
jgi:NADH-quinone oxidoreductase subunit G